jgi:hypothetical protein
MSEETQAKAKAMVEKVRRQMNNRCYTEVKHEAKEGK